MAMELGWPKWWATFCTTLRNSLMLAAAVTVRTRLEDNAALIAVQDNGIGMQPETIARIFDTFSQADRSLARSRGGLGLGLALVKGLVELHDGTVHASSAGLGKGSEFAIRLPLHAGPDTKPVEPEITPTKGQSFRILVIEDNKDAAESTRMLLNLIGHEVQTAHNGETGIALARTFLPQVILCDIGLPGRLSGYDVAKALRQESAFHSTYIIALTGYGRDEDHQQTHAAGFDLHLIKPVDFANLRRTLATLPPRNDSVAITLRVMNAYLSRNKCPICRAVSSITTASSKEHMRIRHRSLELLHARFGSACFDEHELSEMGQTAKLLQPDIGDLAAAQSQLGQGFHSGQGNQPLIRNLCVGQTEFANIGQLLEGV